MQVVTADDHTDAPEQPVEQPGPVSVLDQIRNAGKNARRTRTFVLDLPREHVGEGIGLRLGLPTVAGFTFSDDVAFAANNLSRELGDELTFIAHAIREVISLSDDGDWVKVDGVTVQDLASGYASALTGTDVKVTTDDDAVRWLYSIGTPPQVNAHAASIAAKAYRMWSYYGDRDDPTVGL